jgi:hypothetical protein
MKKLIVSLFILVTITLNAQKIRGFGEVATYLDKELYASGFAKVAIGAEYKINQIIRPEIETSFYFGALNDFENSNSQNQLVDNLKRYFTSFTVSLCPKICIGDKENETNVGFFQILPRYSISKITSKGSLLTVNQTDFTKSTKETDIFSEIRHSLGIGIGVYVNLSEKTNDALALNLYYDGIDFGNSLTNLKFTQGKYTTKNVLGLGINYYFGFVKKKTKL